MPKSDLFIIIGVAIIWLYISVNMNSILGLIYVVMLYLYWNMRQDGKVYPIFRGEVKWGRVIGLSLVIAFAWIYVISGMVGSIAPGLKLEQFQKIFAITDKPMSPYMSLFVVGLLIPITEEMVFRGAIMKFLESHNMNKIILIIVSACVFSVWHLMAYQADNQSMIAGFLFGSLSSYLVQKRGQLVESILVHSMLNTIIMLSSLGFLNIVGVI